MLRDVLAAGLKELACRAAGWLWEQLEPALTAALRGEQVIE